MDENPELPTDIYFPGGELPFASSLDAAYNPLRIDDILTATPYNPITVEELARRGMSDRLTEIIHTVVGEHLHSPEWLGLTDEEKAALGYGTPCPCGEKGLMPDEKLCGCGNRCQQCCEGKCQETCNGNCACKT